MTTDPPAVPAALEAAASEFSSVRPRLFGIAYRMLGSAAEAEDIVQEVWLRWQAYDRSKVLDPAAFLATTATRLAINETRSARARRAVYIGPWLPEPVATGPDPALGAEHGEALEFALLLLLEKLSAPQRAAYVLREAFDYPYDQIAEIVQLTEANVRQLVSRARKQLRNDRRAPVSETERRRLLTAFLAAARSGDFSALEKLFSSDVVSLSDGGGAVKAARIPVLGRERVAKFIIAVSSRFWTSTDITWVEANGQTCFLASRDGAAVALVSLSASTEGIDQILWMMNPSKLATIAQATAGPTAPGN